MISNKWVDCGSCWEHTAPQGDPDWKLARLGRVTTSVSGAMAGRSTFKTPEEQGKYIAGYEKESFSQKAIERMDHGNDTEPEARDWYAKYTGYTIVERGLIVPKQDLTLGASIDGDVINTDGIIEIKCPLTMYYPLKKYMDQIKTGWKPPPNYHKHIWPTHYAQMQHAMAVTGKKWCTYIVYCTTDGSIFTQKIDFNQDYWNDHYITIKNNYERYVKPYLDGRYPIIPG